jgi:signal transduction histidine kinase/ligand-binding sensor domain-containing protein
MFVSAIDVRDVFVAFNNENGRLTNNIVEAVVRDTYGYVWVGTNNGLNRLDGYTTFNYLNDPQNPTSLSGNFIKSLFVDSDGDLWIGTIGGGLNLYDRQNDCFIRFTSDSLSETSLNAPNVSTILQDHHGYIWIGTTGAGIFRYDKKKNIFKHFKLDPSDPLNTNIRIMQCDKSNNIWIGFDYDSNGIYKIEGTTERISFFSPLKMQGKATFLGPVRGIVELSNGRIIIATWQGRFYQVSMRGDYQLDLFRDEQFLNNASITNMIGDNEGNIWVGCWEQGLYLLSDDFNISRRFVNSKMRTTSITSNAVNVLTIDSNNNLWVGHRNNGISLLSLNSPMFHTLPVEVDGETYEGDLDVQSFVKDRSGNLWFATRGQGLWEYNTNNGKFKQYTTQQNNGLKTNYLLTLHQGYDGMLWAGTDGKFITRFDPATGRFTQINYPWGDWSAVFSIAETDRYLYCGTWGSGVKKVDKKTFEVTGIDFDPKDQFRNSVFDLEITDSILWIANIGMGLYKMNLNTGNMKLIFTTGSDDADFPNGRINDIIVENENTLWLSTAGYGAINYNLSTGEINRYDKNNGLAMDIIQSVVPDMNGNYWFLTQQGVTVLQEHQQKASNFFVHNGLLSNAINKSAAYFDKENSKIYLGTQLGINYFNPGKIKIDTVVNKVVISALTVMGKEVPRSNNSYTDAPIEKAQSITLQPDQKVFTISFSAMDFTPSFMNSYSYRLEGFDKEWNHTSYAKNFAQYTNLDPGSYTFYVKTVNHDGIASEETTSIKVIVKPAFYQTIYFRIFILLLTGGIIYMIFNIRVRNLNKAKLKLEQNVALRTLEIEQQKTFIEKQNSMLEESNASKDRFFSIIGHDLSNPMSSIDQLLELLEMEYETMSTKSASQLISHLRKSSSHTLELLKNLMTWAQTQTNRIKIDKQLLPISELFADCYNSCDLIARNKEQSLLFFTDESHVGFFDKNTITTVLRNLITNAVKFSKPNGKIEVTSSITDNKIVISVNDHGIGISESDINRLFKIESIKSVRGTEGEVGTGLGLILCHEFVTLNGGTIWVESRQGVGSTFFFTVDNVNDQL